MAIGCFARCVLGSIASGQCGVLGHCIDAHLHCLIRVAPRSGRCIRRRTSLLTEDSCTTHIANIACMGFVGPLRLLPTSFVGTEQFHRWHSRFNSWLAAALETCPSVASALVSLVGSCSRRLGGSRQRGAGRKPDGAQARCRFDETGLVRQRGNRPHRHDAWRAHRGATSRHDRCSSFNAYCATAKDARCSSREGIHGCAFAIDTDHHTGCRYAAGLNVFAVERTLDIFLLTVSRRRLTFFAISVTEYPFADKWTIFCS